MSSVTLSWDAYVRPSHLPDYPPGATRDLLSSLLTVLAVTLAGQRRSAVSAEWCAHLAGAPEDGITLSPSEKLRCSTGFLIAAARYRLHDMTAPLWRPIDWLLATGRRTIASIVGAQALYIVGDGGLPALVTEIWEPCGIAGAALFTLSRWLRRVRGAELATRAEDRAD
ncbi:hypothetical protein ACFQ61_34445 [Streptomyces sp. NPDC056500]|uniref:hypothetical protein n=1 Tax=Streptomyces sp. NPDC056500 TaxID=3345840 RepID=UPI0036BB1F0D